MTIFLNVKNILAEFTIITAHFSHLSRTEKTLGISFHIYSPQDLALFGGTNNIVFFWLLTLHNHV